MEDFQIVVPCLDEGTVKQEFIYSRHIHKRKDFGTKPALQVHDRAGMIEVIVSQDDLFYGNLAETSGYPVYLFMNIAVGAGIDKGIYVFNAIPVP